MINKWLIWQQPLKLSRLIHVTTNVSNRISQFFWWKVFFLRNFRCENVHQNLTTTFIVTFSVVGGGDKESWVTQNASEARYYASNLWRKQMIRYQELNVSHTSRLETCPVLSTRVSFYSSLWLIWFLEIVQNHFIFMAFLSWNWIPKKGLKERLIKSDYEKVKL